MDKRFKALLISGVPLLATICYRKYDVLYDFLTKHQRIKDKNKRKLKKGDVAV